MDTFLIFLCVFIFVVLPYALLVLFPSPPSGDTTPPWPIPPESSISYHNPWPIPPEPLKVHCDECKGSGRVEDDDCSFCRGTGLSQNIIKKVLTAYKE